jgi:general secretion pathway protein J
MTRQRRVQIVGFTLIEVLVALLIMSVMAVMGWRGLDSMARSRDIGQRASERTLLLNTVVSQFEQDLQAVQDTLAVPALAFDGRSMRLTRRSDGGIQLVVWSLADGRWLRWAAPAATRVADLQESWMRSQQLQGTEPAQLKLLDGVVGWQLYFHQGGAWSNAQSTGDLSEPAPPSPAASGPAARAKLPQGVRLVIELPEGKLTRDVLMRSS